jgi:hypothetical protein
MVYYYDINPVEILSVRSLFLITTDGNREMRAMMMANITFAMIIASVMEMIKIICEPTKQ